MSAISVHRLARAAGVAALLCLSSISATRVDAAETFKVGEASPANTFLAIWMAEAAGLFEAQGLKFEVVHMVGGRESGPDLSSGRIQLMHIGMSSVVRANLAGRNLLCIGSLSNLVRATMFAAPQIKTNAELKGGIFGISSVGSESDSATTLVLRRLGLTRDDVIVKEIGTDRLTPLRSGAVAATLLGEPQRSQAMALGLRVVSDLYAERIPWLYSGLTVDAGYLRSNRDTLMRFLKATIEGNYIAVTDEKRAKDVLARELKLTDPQVIDQSYVNFKAETPANAEIDVEGARNVLAAVAPPNASKNLADYIDTTLTDALRAEGFMAAMEKKYGKK
ncbi:MAG: NitT/TauT family transport system substrate-binding protein [Alphaproteobacteria bacterium]|jgi:ABC-type nitrate/sulfonate/bicarbonate transport system substrate-binding protein|nr:NitT/TauT family transport system substrate-binding protein [Alphaproteobacteria bacterium]